MNRNKPIYRRFFKTGEIMAEYTKCKNRFMGKGYRFKRVFNKLGEEVTEQFKTSCMSKWFLDYSLKCWSMSRAGDGEKIYLN